jgi:uncharacterized protein (DUF302 family)
MAVDGLTTIRSAYGPEETISRLEAEIRAKGMAVFARIDHAAGAADVGLSLRPTEVLLFGNARGGTPLMQSIQTTGIDLPLKVLVWQDASGDTWLSYNDPQWIAKHHRLGQEAEATVSAMSAALGALATIVGGLRNGRTALMATADRANGGRNPLRRGPVVAQLLRAMFCARTESNNPSVV